MLEKKINQYGQEQIIDNFDKFIKMGDGCFLQVRLIKTRHFKDRFTGKVSYTKPMPRARFVREGEEINYIISRTDLIKLKENNK